MLISRRVRRSWILGHAVAGTVMLIVVLLPYFTPFPGRLANGARKYCLFELVFIGMLGPAWLYVRRLKTQSCEFFTAPIGKEAVAVLLSRQFAWALLLGGPSVLASSKYVIEAYEA